MSSAALDAVNQGPLIEEAALQKVERHVQDVLAKGARLLTGGKQSGLGREGSRLGIDDYVEVKCVCIGDILK